MSEGNPLAKGAAWMNGEIMPINEARLPVNDWGILHSDITYDVVPVKDGAFFRLPDYMEPVSYTHLTLPTILLV